MPILASQTQARIFLGSNPTGNCPMRLTAFVHRIIGTVALAALATGCATYQSISTAEAGTAKVMSGTRLNTIPLQGTEPPSGKFKAAPPANPAVDLPFSFALDVLILPLTIPAVLYEGAFEPKTR